MRLLTVEQARAIDRDAVERLGMPSILLMENASRAVADAARQAREFETCEMKLWLYTEDLLPELSRERLSGRQRA